MPESATEWIASASIDDAPVRAKAANFVTAMKQLASNAAMTALVPPSALTRTILPDRRETDDDRLEIREAVWRRYQRRAAAR